MKKYIMVLATVFWAGAFIAGKFSIEEFPIMSLVFFRFLISTLVIFPLMIRLDKDWKITKANLPIFLKLGIIGIIGYHLLFFLCLKFTTATNSSLIGATNPIITTILACIVLKEKITKRHVISIILSMCGVILIFSNGSINTFKDFSINIGDAIMIVAVVCWAIYSIISKKAVEKYSPIKVTSYSFLVCTVIMFPLIFLEKPHIYLPQVSIYGWMSVIYMAVFASVCGYLIQQISIKDIGPSKTNLYINLVPVFSMIMAYFILDEKINLIKVLAAIFIISGILIAYTSKKENLKEIEENE